MDETIQDSLRLQNRPYGSEFAKIYEARYLNGKQ